MKSSLGEQKVHKSMNFVHDLATLLHNVININIYIINIHHMKTNEIS